MKAPFPWFGGKSRVADIIWQRFGDVPNYVEPFFGSGAVLLARPHTPKIETINDADQFLANFWRAVKNAPDAVADHADWPVNEADLHARHYWLTTQGREHLQQIMGDPDAYDAKIAGWWVWGLCCWIGSGWCEEPGGPWQWDGQQWVKRKDSGRGVNRKLPHLGDLGRGVNRQGQPVHQLLNALSERLRKVRVACGDWSRVVGDSVTHKHGLTGVFLDPPYSGQSSRSDVYAVESFDVAHETRKWALENGNNPLLRICLAGYEGEHKMPGWEIVRWKTKGGYGSQGQGRGRDNSSRECLWFSPHCLKDDQGRLF